MIWLSIGLAIGVIIGAFLMAALSITRHRLTQAVADAAGVYLTTELDEDWCQLRDAYDRLMAE